MEVSLHEIFHVISQKARGASIIESVHRV